MNTFRLSGKFDFYLSIAHDKGLCALVKRCNRKLLTGAGSVSHKQALEKAKSEYRKYQEITLTPVEKAYLESIKEVSKEVKRR